jgi:hypothetical protein
MSKTQDKKQERITEHAETLWNEAQMKAALMQQMLDIAVAEIEEHQEELEKTEHWAKLQESMKERQKDIEEFLMSKKGEYLERIGIQQD